MLQLYTGLNVEIYEYAKPFQIGVVATIGEDTAIGGGLSHYFFAMVTLRRHEVTDLSRKKQIIQAIIEQEKPADTKLHVRVVMPEMTVGEYCMSVLTRFWARNHIFKKPKGGSYD